MAAAQIVPIAACDWSSQLPPSRCCDDQLSSPGLLSALSKQLHRHPSGGSVGLMRNPFKYFNSSPEVIRLAVMLYVRFPLHSPPKPFRQPLWRQVVDRMWDVLHTFPRFGYYWLPWFGLLEMRTKPVTCWP